jgi:hypothetical protein
MLITSANNLTELSKLLQQINSEEYTKQHFELSNATIGEHMRHIIEMYQCLIISYENGIVNYDLRNRDLGLQTKLELAIAEIELLKNKIPLANKKMLVNQGKNEVTFSIETNYFRELLYNLEHSIHHQALIKVALLKLPHVKISENFGVARSTIEYRTQCAQ